jgi:hypothetical protein
MALSIAANKSDTAIIPWKLDRRLQQSYVCFSFNIRTSSSKEERAR